MTEAQRAEASKNPVAWVTDFATAWALGAIDYKYNATGPGHAHQFTCSASIAGIHARGGGVTKAQARTTAVAGVLSALIAVGDRDAEGRSS